MKGRRGVRCGAEWPRRWAPAGGRAPWRRPRVARRGSASRECVAGVHSPSGREGRTCSHIASGGHALPPGGGSPGTHSRRAWRAARPRSQRAASAHMFGAARLFSPVVRPASPGGPQGVASRRLCATSLILERPSHQTCASQADETLRSAASPGVVWHMFDAPKASASKMLHTTGRRRPPARPGPTRSRPPSARARPGGARRRRCGRNREVWVRVRGMGRAGAPSPEEAAGGARAGDALPRGPPAEPPRPPGSCHRRAP